MEGKILSNFEKKMFLKSDICRNLRLIYLSTSCAYSHLCIVPHCPIRQRFQTNVILSVGRFKIYYWQIAHSKLWSNISFTQHTHIRMRTFSAAHITKWGGGDQQIHTYLCVRHFRVQNLLVTSRAHLPATMRGRSGNILKLKTQIKAKPSLWLPSRRYSI